MVLAAVLLAAMAVSGCTGPRLDEQRVSSVADPGVVKRWTQQHPAETVTWANCEAPETMTSLPDWDPTTVVECATLTVPIEWKNLSGATPVTAVRVLPTGTHQQNLFVNPGGPGLSSAEFAVRASTFSALSTVREHTALIGIDPRGVQSTLLNHDSEPTLCARLTKGSCEAAVKQHASTAEAAFDMEYVRQLLNEEHLNYLGYAYGTYLGAIYASVFPDSVGNMLLDSAMSPRFGGDGFTGAQTEGYERALDRFLGACVADELPTCPLSGTTTQARGQLINLRDRLTDTPLHAAGIAITGTTLQQLIINALSSGSTAWPELAAVLHEFVTGQPTEHTAAALAAQPPVPEELSLAVTCATPAANQPSDRGVPPLRSRPFFGNAHPDLTAHHDRLKKNTDADDADDADELETICAAGDGPAWTDPDIRYRGTQPMLMVSGAADPVAPLSGALELREAIGNAKLITVDGEGHQYAFTGRSACVDQQAAHYLQYGTLPSDEYCVPEHP